MAKNGWVADLKWVGCRFKVGGLQILSGWVADLKWVGCRFKMGGLQI